MIFARSNFVSVRRGSRSLTAFGLFSFKRTVTVQLNMSEQRNGEHPAGAKQHAGSKISRDQWQQIKTAYASGIALREIARNMGIPEGTVLARTKREGWTSEIQSAKALTKHEDALMATPVEAVAMSLCSNAGNATWSAWRASARRRSPRNNGSSRNSQIR